MKSAHIYYEDGKKWLRIDPEGLAHDEPIDKWQYVMHVNKGYATFRHKDGREFLDYGSEEQYKKAQEAEKD